MSSIEELILEAYEREKREEAEYARIKENIERLESELKQARDKLNTLRFMVPQNHVYTAVYKWLETERKETTDER